MTFKAKSVHNKNIIEIFAKVSENTGLQHFSKHKQLQKFMRPIQKFLTKQIKL